MGQDGPLLYTLKHVVDDLTCHLEARSCGTGFLIISIFGRPSVPGLPDSDSTRTTQKYTERTASHS
jgi:hypothetical protein